eukprot:23110-Pelagococcus_subviridis.AAC.1
MSYETVMCIGVCPCAFAAEGSAPRSRRRLTSSECPFCAATWRHRFPLFGSVAFASSASTTMARTTSILFHRIALCASL